MTRTFYEVWFNNQTDTLGHFSRITQTKRAALTWARWLAKQKYVSMVQVLNAASKEIVFEQHHKGA